MWNTMNMKVVSGETTKAYLRGKSWPFAEFDGKQLTLFTNGHDRDHEIIMAMNLFSRKYSLDVSVFVRGDRLMASVGSASVPFSGNRVTLNCEG